MCNTNGRFRDSIMIYGLLLDKIVAGWPVSSHSVLSNVWLVMNSNTETAALAIMLVEGSGF